MKSSRIGITDKTIIRRIVKELTWFSYKKYANCRVMEFDENSSMGKLFDKLYGFKNIKNLTGVKRKFYEI